MMSSEWFIFFQDDLAGEEARLIGFVEVAEFGEAVAGGFVEEDGEND